MSDYQVTFGSNIRKLRKQCGLTQAQLAERSGLSERYVSEVERGVANPRLMSLRDLAKGLDVSIADLFVFEQGLTSVKEIRERLIELLQNAGDDSLEQVYLTLLRALTSRRKD